MTLPDPYRIEAMGPAGPTQHDVIAFWEREGAVIGAEALRRVHEVLLVATHRDDGIAGIATAYLAHNDQLGMGLWHYRVFVAAAHRMSNIAFHLVTAGRDLLERRHSEGVDTRGAGVVFEVENAAIRASFPQAVWRRTGFTFIGQNDRGAHVRVRYFPGAAVPPAR